MCTLECADTISFRVVCTALSWFCTAATLSDVLFSWKKSKSFLYVYIISSLHTSLWVFFISVRSGARLVVTAWLINCFKSRWKDEGITQNLFETCHPILSWIHCLDVSVFDLLRCSLSLPLSHLGHPQMVEKKSLPWC